MEALRLCINLEFAVELMVAEALFLQGSQKKEQRGLGLRRCVFCSPMRSGTRCWGRFTRGGICSGVS